MVNFMGQFECATGCSDIQSNIILGVPVRAFLNKTNIKIGRLSKNTALLDVNGPHPIS